MAEYLGKWPFKRGPISKIKPSDGCGRDAVHLAVDQWYDFHEFGCHLGNVGRSKRDSHIDPQTSSNAIMQRAQPLLQREQ